MPIPRDVVEIIVKLEEGGLLRSASASRVDAEHVDLSELLGIVSGVPGARLERSFQLDPELQRSRNTYAATRLGRPVPSSNLFLRLLVPAHLDVDDIVHHVDAAHGVEYACRASIPGPPPQVADLSGTQGYGDPAPDGVDVQYAWSLPGGRGAGVTVCDCEYAFDPDHEDLDVDDVVTGLGALEAALPGVESEWVHHGTAVLGILGATRDTKGVTGLCDEARILFASEQTHARTVCIEMALDELGPGDVLLLEMQVGPEPQMRPAEADPDVHALILEAVGNEVTVIEAAGNGGSDLADLEDATGKKIWTVGGPQEDDSGALLVGAGLAPAAANAYVNARTASPSSNHGTRVDCQGWGGYVVTTGYGIHPSAVDAADYNGGPHKEYTNDFDGTSAASAVVAAAVACLQGAAQPALGGHVLPETVRELFGTDGLGSPWQGSWDIGPLPDLYRILREAGILPAIGLRDAVGSYAGPLLRRPRRIRGPVRTLRSPDLIVRRQPANDPDAELGPASWASADLCEEIQPGSDHWVYVRAENFGTVPDRTRVFVYQAPPATYFHPRTWKPIGDLDLGTLAPGERVVAGPIRWGARQLPRVGRCALIGVVQGERDRVSVPGANASDARYIVWLMETTAIAFRAVHRVSVPSGGESEPVPIAIPGRADADGRFQVAFLHDLPRGSTVTVTSSAPLTGSGLAGTALGRPVPREYAIGDERGLLLEDVLVPRGSTVVVHVAAHVPAATPGQRFPFAMAQIQRGLLLGGANLEFDVV